MIQVVLKKWRGATDISIYFWVGYEYDIIIRPILESGLVAFSCIYMKGNKKNYLAKGIFFVNRPRGLPRARIPLFRGGGPVFDWIL